MERVRPSSPTDPELAGLGAEGGADWKGWEWGGAWGGAGDCWGGAGGRGCDWRGGLGSWAGSESRVGLGAAWEDTAGVGAVLALQGLLLLSHVSRV